MHLLRVSSKWHLSKGIQNESHKDLLKYTALNRGLNALKNLFMKRTAVKRSNG